MNSNNPKSTLSESVRRRRKTLALTQQDVADLAGCARLFVYDLEKGKSTIRLQKLMDVLQVLGMQLSIENGTGGFVDNTDATN